MALWWVVDPVSGQGAPLNDAAAKEAAADGAMVYAYAGQDGGMGGYGIDPNANMPHQITADKVLVYNANTDRYEWMSSALVAAQQAATGQYDAQTRRAATAADIIAASRGPENAFQYSNALHGQADAAGVGIFDALAGRIGGATGAGTPRSEDLHPIDIMDRVNAIVNRSFGTGGEVGSGSSAWADAAGMAPTQTEQRAQGTMQDAARTAQEGQQAAPEGMGVSEGMTAAQAAARYGAQYVEPGSATMGNAARTAARYGAQYVAPGSTTTGNGGMPAGTSPGDVASTTMQPGGVNALGLPMNALGKLDTSQYERASGLSGSGDSDIRWKNKSHDLIRQRGYGHGSDARNAAHKAAGMSGEEFDRVIKHGGDPFKQRHAARGMMDVVTQPQTIHVGEGGKDEAVFVWPLERGDTPVPRALLSLANQMSPDLDGQRGIGNMAKGDWPPGYVPQRGPIQPIQGSASGGWTGVEGASPYEPGMGRMPLLPPPVGVELNDYTGQPIPDTRYTVPQLGGAGGSAHGGWTGQMPPGYGVAPLDPLQTAPMGPPGTPELNDRPRPGGYHMAQGGGLAVQQSPNGLPPTLDLADRYSAEWGIDDPLVLRALIMAESEGDPNAVGDNGNSIGLLQANMAGGRGQGYTADQLRDPDFNLRIAQAEVTQAYAEGKAQGLAGRDLARHVAIKAQRPREDTYDRYSNWYDSLSSGQPVAPSAGDAGLQTAPPPAPPASGVGPVPAQQPRPPLPLGMAAGGGLAVIGGSTNVTSANSAPDAAGQVRVPKNGGTRMYPASKTVPMPDFGALPPALLSLIGPSDWKLIGSQYGAEGGNSADIPFLLTRALRGLGRAPAAYGGPVY